MHPPQEIGLMIGEQLPLEAQIKERSYSDLLGQGKHGQVRVSMYVMMVHHLGTILYHLTDG